MLRCSLLRALGRLTARSHEIEWAVSGAAGWSSFVCYDTASAEDRKALLTRSGAADIQIVPVLPGGGMQPTDAA